MKICLTSSPLSSPSLAGQCSGVVELGQYLSALRRSLRCSSASSGPKRISFGASSFSIFGAAGALGTTRAVDTAGVVLNIGKSGSSTARCVSTLIIASVRSDAHTSEFQSSLKALAWLFVLLVNCKVPEVGKTISRDLADANDLVGYKVCAPVLRTDEEEIAISYRKCI